MSLLPREILAEELEALKTRIIANHEAAGQMASGRTAASLRVETAEGYGILWGRKPFGTLERGRKPGNVPGNFQQIIMQWMKDKGITASPIPYLTNRPHKYTPQERGTLQLAFLIARKIRTEGTLLFRTGGRNDIYSHEIKITIENVQSRLLSLVKKEIETIQLNGVTLE